MSGELHDRLSRLAKRIVDAAVTMALTSDPLNPLDYKDDGVTLDMVYEDELDKAAVGLLIMDSIEEAGE